jgi:hypothetical protein
MKKSAKSIRIETLKNANKETRTLSGAIKIVRSFWSDYKDAFTFVNASYKTFTFERVLDFAQKDGQGRIYETRKVAQKDKDGNKIKDGQGRVKYDLVNKEVKVWTPTTLYYVLAQSNNIEEYR